MAHVSFIRLSPCELSPSTLKTPSGGQLELEFAIVPLPQLSSLPKASLNSLPRIHTSPISFAGKHLFEEDDMPFKKKKDKKGITDEEKSEEDSEEAESDEDYDENEPVRPKRPVKMELYNVEEVTKLLRTLKATDITVIDVSEKVNWVSYMVYATGRSKSHIKSMANSLVMELKMRRPGRRWGVDQEGCDFWKIVNSGDILVNLFTEEEREEYDLERTWILRRDDRNPFRADYDEEEEDRWVYDEEDEGYMINDPDVEKIKGFKD